MEGNPRVPNHRFQKPAGVHSPAGFAIVWSWFMPPPRRVYLWALLPEAGL